LVWTAGKGNLTIANLLIDAGADVNLADNDGITPLMEAARSGSEAMVQLLLEKGAVKNAKDSHGHTAADIAEKKHRDNILTHLR
jgi:ankyrin repeat protein